MGNEEGVYPTSTKQLLAAQQTHCSRTLSEHWSQATIVQNMLIYITGPEMPVDYCYLLFQRGAGSHPDNMHFSCPVLSHSGSSVYLSWALRHHCDPESLTAQVTSQFQPHHSVPQVLRSYCSIYRNLYIALCWSQCLFQPPSPSISFFWFLQVSTVPPKYEFHSDVLHLACIKTYSSSVLARGKFNFKTSAIYFQ